MLRVWERRYQAVLPVRTGKGARLYSEAQSQRLRLLAGLVQSGLSIGTIAHLPDEQLEEMKTSSLTAAAAQEAPHAENQPALARTSVNSTPGGSSPRTTTEQFLEAIERLDVGMADQLISQAALLYDPIELLDHVVSPIMRAVGSRWAKGDLSIRHEHACTGVLRRLLDRLTLPPVGAGRGTVVTAALTGERHELGSMMAGLIATRLGFRVVYLGADCPAQEVALAARQLQAKVILLSFVCIEPSWGREQLSELFECLRSLHQQKEAKSAAMNDAQVLIGGKTAPDLLPAKRVEDLSSLCEILSATQPKR